MIFLDNAATTESKFFRSNYKDFWMNSNTPYTRTKEQLALEKAKEKIKSCLGVKGGYVLFFRCSSEAIEWLANKFRTDEVWCSPYEHDSVINVSDKIVTADTKFLFNKEEYGLYCQQLVNPITGDIWDIKNLKNLFITKSTQFIGIDGTASIGHIPIPKNLEEICDAFWFSGHKFHTEKNIGCMWISERLYIYLGMFPNIANPKNQYDLVHGTVDVQGACMLAEALEEACENVERTSTFYTHFILELISQLNTYKINNKILSCSNNKTDAINALYLENINADALQTYLASMAIYVGTAHSACADNEDYRVLEAMGFSKEIARQTIRISFSYKNSIQDIIELADQIKKFKELF